MANRAAVASLPERGEGGGTTPPSAGPDLSSWQADGRAATVSLRDANKVHVTPLRGKPLSNESDLFYVVYWCGVRLQMSREASAQSLVLVGTGERETLNCDGVKAFGAVPAPRGGWKLNSSKPAMPAARARNSALALIGALPIAPPDRFWPRFARRGRASSTPT